ncbi:GNAT family N-acetyltransferase, partial [Vibrio sp. 03_296]|uniref:GNAT family N-acetyltransferase n=1 Tax=Vibrio sp. 03_296 TaxID=2024409 RepID=UPI002D802D67
MFGVCRQVDEEVVGLCQGILRADFDSERPLQMGSVDELYVGKPFRQQGIAEALLARIEQTFRDYGVEQVFVEVWDFNQTAIAVYEKNG